MFSPNTQVLLGVTIAVYVIVMFGIGWFAKRRVHTMEDYVVAGRRLPLYLAWTSLVATWFGAGTMLAVSDEVRREGLWKMALDPLGAGACLILAGLLVAKPLWQMNLLTVSDFFRRKFGPTAELISALILVPSYFGLVATQFVALADMLNLMFGIDHSTAMLLIAVVGTSYTLIGGMWSVTLTDSVQLALIFIGCGMLWWISLTSIGDGSIRGGFFRLTQELPPKFLEIVPRHDPQRLFEWFSLLCVGALGNLPGQDLLQRVFAAKSASVAKQACIIGGVVYIVVGMAPVTLGLVATIMFPDQETSIMAALANQFLSPWAAAIFMIAVLAAVISTIESAILAGSTVLAQNIFTPFSRQKISPLKMNRAAVVLVAFAGVLTGLSGDRAFSLLKNAYEMVFVGMSVPLLMGIYTTPRSQLPALASMISGISLWLSFAAFGWSTPWQIPSSLFAAGTGLIAYLALDLFVRTKTK